MILNFNSKEKIVGTFLISVFILLLSLVVLIGRGKDWFKKNVIYYASFSESYNIDKNASVKLFSADIGKVTNVTLVGNKVEFTLAIFEDFAHRIKTDSIASIEGISYIGNKYISIKPGTQKAEILRHGGKIRSAENKSLSDLLAEFEVEKTAKKVIQSIQDLSELVHILKDPEGPLFTGLASINKSLFEIEQRIGLIMENSVVASSKFPKTVEQFNKDLEKIHEVSERLVENIAVVRKILDNVEKGSKNVPAITISTKDKLQKAGEMIQGVNEVTKALKKNILLRSNVPEAPKGDSIDAGLR